MRFAPLTCLLLLAGSATAADEMGAVKAETLLATGTAWDGEAYKAYPAGDPELSILRITVPAHTRLAWHEHPMPNAAYILSGTLTIEKQGDGKTKIVHAGDAVAEMADTVHRGVTGDVPVVLLAFYAGAKGVGVSKAAP
ncbi:MAG TPA: cupin domain-containing protein [Alphaproteobacteria bacterium]|jgi:quercetin dioxygenase-like cupin family protein|nr:cupin domain-containing protein [Alphaproteobacteria bacterium]